MINEAGYSKATALLHKASTPLGFVASVNDHDNYKRVWTRDGVVSGLAALLSGDTNLIETFESTLKTIFDHQHAVGFMPSNVSPDGKVSYGGTVGRADNPAWAVVGICHYVLTTNHTHFGEKYKHHVEKCLALMEAWEFNGKHLVYVPQSGDWADEYIQHGYVLFDQLLRVWALRLAARVYARIEWHHKANEIVKVIQKNFWNYNLEKDLYSPNLKHQRKGAPTRFWFLGFNPARIYHQFDLQANSLALLLGISDEQQAKSVINFIADLADHFQSILPSYFPSIENQDWEMKELENNFAYTFRNTPHEFHNGGLWPVWNGLLAAMLARQKEVNLAQKITAYIHEANACHDWELNECLHGQTKQPIGVAYCTWSASGAVIAEKCVENKDAQLIF